MPRAAVPATDEQAGHRDARQKEKSLSKDVLKQTAGYTYDQISDSGSDHSVW